jgi:hypothetical protein
MILKENRLVDTHYPIPEYDIGYHLWYVDEATSSSVSGEVVGLYMMCDVQDDGAITHSIEYILDTGAVITEEQVTDYIENELAG